MDMGETVEVTYDKNDYDQSEDLVSPIADI